MKKGNGSIDEKIRERYNGVNDPIAKKILDKFDTPVKQASVPSDSTITTLFLGGVSGDVEVGQVSELMEAFGKVARIKLESKHKRGFVCFETR
jgi:pre-mRNA-splicing factor RBM22/SLT11